MDITYKWPPRVRKFTAAPSPSANAYPLDGRTAQEEVVQVRKLVPRSRSLERLPEISERQLERDRGVRRRAQVDSTVDKPGITITFGRKRSEARRDVEKDGGREVVKAVHSAPDEKSTDSVNEKEKSVQGTGSPASEPLDSEIPHTDSESKQQALLEFDALYTDHLTRESAQAQIGELKIGTDTSAHGEGEKEVKDSHVIDEALPDQDIAGHDDGILRTPSRKTTWNEKVIKRSKPNPPYNDVVDPFGGLKSPDPMRTRTNPFAPDEADGAEERGRKTVEIVENQAEEDITQRPTCSLNLVCYSRGCSMVQIRVSTRMRHANEGAFKKVQREIPGLITSDETLFKALRKAYWADMCGFWRSWFSLKTLRRLRLLSYVNNDRPQPVPWDDYTMQEVLAAFNDPSEFGSDTDWIEWVFSLRQNDKRHMLEFVEGWNAARIAILGSIPCLASTLVGVVWSARGGDVQTAFTVAGFILTVATVLLALLAVISAIDSKSD